MSLNQLKLNTNKTQFMWLGSRQQVVKAQMQCQILTLDGSEIEFCTELVCLGVVFDPELTFAVHIRPLLENGSTICGSCALFAEH